MKEYTLSAVAAAVFVVLLDYVLHTHVLRQRLFWLFLAVMYCFKVVVNGYLTWRPIVLYGDEYYLGVRLFTIPVEDFVYGFGVIAASVIVWEYFMRSKKAGTTGREY